MKRMKIAGILLLVSSVLLAVSAFFGLAGSLALVFSDEDMLREVSSALAVEGFGGSEASAILFMRVAGGMGILESSLQLCAGLIGVVACRGKIRAETCQFLGIVLVGIAFISSLSLGLVSHFDGTSIVDFVFSVILPVFYYAAARSEVRSTFWDGIKKAPIDIADDGASVIESPRVPLYRLNDGFLETMTSEDEESPAVRMITMDEFDRVYRNRTPALLTIDEGTGYCYANVIPPFVVGVLCIPSRSNNDEKGHTELDDVQTTFLLHKDQVVFASDDDRFRLTFERYLEHQKAVSSGSLSVLFGFLEYLVRNETRYLNDRQRSLDRLEGNMSEDVNEVPRDFEDYVADARKSLRRSQRFCKQHASMCHAMASFHLDGGAETIDLSYEMLAERSQRLAEDAQELLDYALQIQGLFQSKTDVRQNKVMQVLTVVASIFMPLTLMTGWYGMNFKGMPELQWGFSYYAFIVFSIVIVTVEIVVFKKKKWF